MRAYVFRLVVCGISAVGCTRPAPNDKSADSAGASAALVASTPRAPISWRFEEPASWDERVRMVDDAYERARLATLGIHGARRFEYIPRDSSLMPQVLLGFWVYDSTAWAKEAAEEGPPKGEEIARGPGVVYIAGLPQSNPFAPGSVDFVEFAKRSVTLASVKRSFRAVPSNW